MRSIFRRSPEARNWIEESKYANAHEDVFVATDTTVDQWFDFWIENIVGDLAPPIRFATIGSGMFTIFSLLWAK